MSKLLHTVSSLLLSLFLALAGCGDPVVDPSYRGEPLMTLSGQLSALPSYSSKGPLHLALAWFPRSSVEGEQSGQQPGTFTMVAEDVRFEGSFPAQFRFEVFAPPPAEVMEPWGEGVQGRGAIALLVAYEDLNGNGKLDSIPADGAAQDRVVGASPFEGNRSYMLAYLDTAQPQLGMSAGFNLLGGGPEGEQALLPLSTPISLTLTEGGDLYDALMCEAGWGTFLLFSVCGLGDGEQLPPFSHLGVSGEVKLQEGHLQVGLTATFAGEPLTDGQLTLGGRALGFDAQTQSYVLSEDASTLLTPGTPVKLELSARGESTFRMLQVPGPFSISAPGAGAEVSNAVPLTLQWTAAEHATGYRVELDSAASYVSLDAPEGALSYDFGELPYSDGAATVRVEALADPTALFDSVWVRVSVVQAQHFTLVTPSP